MRSAVSLAISADGSFWPNSASEIPKNLGDVLYLRVGQLAAAISLQRATVQSRLHPLMAPTDDGADECVFAQLGLKPVQTFQRLLGLRGEAKGFD